ncbi:hypothetical protein MC885_020086 [Smutsia gigantea]|nr:hypothetical protein MC885_020086 [Smutsia gigantea]
MVAWGPRSALAEVHRQRRDLLRRACSRHTRRQRLLQPEDLRHVLVDDAHGLLYCYVPKVACTNWKRVLLALSGHARGDPRAISAHEAHAPGRLRSLADFSPAEINRRLRAYLAFLFVREPFERLASAYCNKFARPYSAAFQRRYGTRIVRRLRPPTRGRAGPRPRRALRRVPGLPAGPAHAPRGALQRALGARPCALPPLPPALRRRGQVRDAGRGCDLCAGPGGRAQPALPCAATPSQGGCRP